MTLVESLQKDIAPYLSDTSSTASLLKRVLLFLEDGEFTQADSYCEKVLDTDPENPLAYLCKLMASRRILSLNDLSSTQYTVDSDSSFKKAVRFAPEEMKEHLHQLNMLIYSNCIEASRNRARIHMAHGELKETAQQYHNAMKLWEDSHETLPNADAIYNDLANEVADFNWKLLLHNRQCPDDSQLIARSIPFNTERWYASAIKWADAEKKTYFESVAKETLFNAHLKCMEAVKTKQTRLAQIWADHYKAATVAEDILPEIHQALVDTDGFSKFAADAPSAMLKLIGHYKEVYPQGVDEIKNILQGYYEKIFQSLLDFTGKEPQPQPAPTTINEDAYAILIAQQEANACASEAEVIPIQDSDTPAETPATDPVWATEVAGKITGQMKDAIAADLSPYGVVSTYLIAAKELTIRYGKKDGIVTEPLLFNFICQYYTDALSQAQEDQAAAIQTKFNDFLIDTVRLPSASTEIVAGASACMQGSNLPYQIYLSRITNNYSVKKEELIPPQTEEDLEKWLQYLEAANPKRDCYWISDQQENISAAFSAAESAAGECRQYAGLLQQNLNTPYQDVLTASGDGSEELSSGWNQKMEALQNHCDEWSDNLEQNLNQAKELNSAKLVIAQKQIKLKEALQLTLSIFMNLLLLFSVYVLVEPLIRSISDGIDLLQATTPLVHDWLFFGLSIGIPVLAGILSLTNGLIAPTYVKKSRQKLIWLFLIFSVVSYMAIHLNIATMVCYPDAIGLVPETSIKWAATLLPFAIGRTLLECFLCKLKEYTRSYATQVSCRVGSITAKVLGLVQALACFAVAVLYICCLILAL